MDKYLRNLNLWFVPLQEFWLKSDATDVDNDFDFDNDRDVDGDDNFNNDGDVDSGDDDDNEDVDDYDDDDGNDDVDNNEVVDGDPPDNDLHLLGCTLPVPIAGRAPVQQL